MRRREPVVLLHQRVPFDDGGEGHGHDPQARPQRYEVRDRQAPQAHIQLHRAAELRRAAKGRFLFSVCVCAPSVGGWAGCFWNCFFFVLAVVDVRAG